MLDFHALLRHIQSSFRDLIQFLEQRVRLALTSAEAWLSTSKHATYGFAVTRIFLGLSALGFLLSNFSTRYYTYGSGAVWNLELDKPRNSLVEIPIFGYFRWAAENDTMFTLGYLALLALAIAIVLGWRTKIVIPVFLAGWVGLIELNDAVGDQGDNAMRIALIILLFADTSQRWSLDARRRQAHPGHQTRLARFRLGLPMVPAWFTTIIHNIAWIVLAAQIIMIYGAGGLYKATGVPWQNGQAVYAPLHTDRFGTWPWLSELMSVSPVILTAVAWSTILFQIGFGAMLFYRPTRILAILGVSTFHVAIGVFMGLPWFSMTMLALDAILISDRTWQKVGAHLVALARSARPAPATKITS